jgi:hypothetical protein
MYFGLALFSSNLDNVTNWYLKYFGNGDVIDWFQSGESLYCVMWPNLGGWGNYTSSVLKIEL